jgi:hypothetical protein
VRERERERRQREGGDRKRERIESNMILLAIRETDRERIGKKGKES